MAQEFGGSMAVHACRSTRSKGRARRCPISRCSRWRRIKIDPAHAPLLAFEDIAPKLGIHHLNGNGTAAWGDIDGDGDLDLIVAGSGVFIRVYRNEGDKFTDVTEAVGLGQSALAATRST